MVNRAVFTVLYSVFLLLKLFRMDLVYADHHSVNTIDLKRFLMLANSITFVNRPSIRLTGNYLTVGVLSNIEPIKDMFTASPVKVNVVTPPSSIFNSHIYAKYFESDLQNKEFIQTVLDGIKNNYINDIRINYNEKHEGEYKDYRNWINMHHDLLLNADYISLSEPDNAFHITNENEALFGFKLLLSEMSIQCTATLDACNTMASNPITKDVSINRLLSQRIDNTLYTGETTLSRMLAVKLMESVISDDALLRMEVEQILAFRDETKPYYDAWVAQIKKLEADLIKEKYNYTDQEIKRFIESNVEPELHKLKNEMLKIRDNRLKDILKVVVNNSIAIISSGALHSMGIPYAISAFVIGNIKTPELINSVMDSYGKQKDVKWDNSYTYLFKVKELAAK